MNSKGYTLVELVISMVVITIAFYALISVFITVVPQNVKVEEIAKTTYLANRVMDETVVKSFTSIESVPITAFNPPFDQYRYQVVKNYVTTAEPDSVYPGPGSTPLIRVKVRVWKTGSGTLEFTTLVGTYEKL